MNLNDLKDKAGYISDRIFGAKNPTTAPVRKLKEEVEELLECLDNGQDPEVEFADCFLLLIDAYRKYYGNDVDMTKLIQASDAKLDVVKERTWGKPDEHGVYKHIKE